MRPRSDRERQGTKRRKAPTGKRTPLKSSNPIPGMPLLPARGCLRQMVLWLGRKSRVRPPSPTEMTTWPPSASCRLSINGRVKPLDTLVRNRLTKHLRPGHVHRLRRSAPTGGPLVPGQVGQEARRCRETQGVSDPQPGSAGHTRTRPGERVFATRARRDPAKKPKTSTSRHERSRQ